MRYLIDTQVLLRAAQEPERLSPTTRDLIGSPGNALFFSAASLWEIAIKASLRRRDFEIDPKEFRQQLTANDYVELPVTGTHAIRVANLPPKHGDPFDRLLLAQAICENIMLVTADRRLAGYGDPVQHV